MNRSTPPNVEAPKPYVYKFEDYPRVLKHADGSNKTVSDAAEEAAAAELGYARTRPAPVPDAPAASEPDPGPAPSSPKAAKPAKAK